MNLFALSATLEMDIDGFEEAVRKAKASAEGLGEELDKTTQKTKGTDSPLSEPTEQARSFFDVVGGILTSNVITKAADQLFGFGKKGVEVASSLEEVQNVLDVTFGDDAAAIGAWAKKANAAFGLTELQAKQYTSTMGAMLKSSGLTGDAIKDMSIDLAGLTADMASFYNIDNYDEAFAKIRAGISGETESLKRLGIDMGETSLEEYRLAQGIETAYNKMSQAEKYQLRYNYLMDATKDAQGDFARTSDGYANAMRTLSGNIETLSGVLGEQLLPIMTDFANTANSLFSHIFKEELGDTLTGFEADAEAAAQGIERTTDSVLAYADVLDSIGDGANMSAEENAKWLRVVDQMVTAFPALSEIVDTTTGEIEGGTDAIREYMAAWAEGEQAKNAENFAQQKTAAMESAQDSLLSLSVQVEQGNAALERNLQKRYDLIDELSQTIGFGTGQDYLDAMGMSVEDVTVGFLPEGATKEQKERMQELIEEGASLSQSLSGVQEEYDALSAQIDTANEKFGEIVTESAGVTEALSDVAKEAENAADSLNQHDAAYNNAQSTMDGVISGIDSRYGAVQNRVNSVNSLLSSMGTVSVTPRFFTTAGNAHGLDYVPYDDYPTYLHRGETVLTRTEAAAYRAGGIGQIDEGALASAIGQEVARIMSGLSVVMDGETVGRITAPSVSRAIADGAYRMRYST